MEMIKFISCKHEKFIGKNTMYYAPLKMFLLYDFISLTFKLVGDF